MLRESSMNRKKLSYLFVARWGMIVLLALIPQVTFSVPLKDSSPVLRSGDIFPSISFPNLSSTEDRKYLGIGDGKLLIFDNIPSDVLVIKFLNTNCVYCIKLLPTFNEIYQTIEKDQNLKTRIKIAAIGAGDTTSELDEFKKKYSIPYPVIPDTEFKAHKAVGEPRVPFIVVARKNKQGQWIVATVNIGLIFSAENFVGELKSILDVDPESLKLKK